jgi:hypothetical protein
VDEAVIRSFSFVIGTFRYFEIDDIMNTYRLWAFIDLYAVNMLNYDDACCVERDVDMLYVYNIWILPHEKQNVVRL